MSQGYNTQFLTSRNEVNKSIATQWKPSLLFLQSAYSWQSLVMEGWLMHDRDAPKCHVHPIDAVSRDFQPSRNYRHMKKRQRRDYKLVFPGHSFVSLHRKLVFQGKR